MFCFFCPLHANTLHQPFCDVKEHWQLIQVNQPLNQVLAGFHPLPAKGPRIILDMDKGSPLTVTVGVTIQVLQTKKVYFKL